MPGDNKQVAAMRALVVGSGGSDGSGGGGKEWKLIRDVTIAEEDAAATLFLDKDSEGNPFSCEEITIKWIGIAVADGTPSGKAWISINPSRAGYNLGKNGFVSNSYFYYTATANYENALLLRLLRNYYWNTEGHSGATDETDIHALEISGYGQKAFYGRVIVYGR